MKSTFNKALLLALVIGSPMLAGESLTFVTPETAHMDYEGTAYFLDGIEELGRVYRGGASVVATPSVSVAAPKVGRVAQLRSRVSGAVTGAAASAKAKATSMKESVSSTTAAVTASAKAQAEKAAKWFGPEERNVNGLRAMINAGIEVDLRDPKISVGERVALIKEMAEKTGATYSRWDIAKEYASAAMNSVKSGAKSVTAKAKEVAAYVAANKTESAKRAGSVAGYAVAAYAAYDIAKSALGYFRKPAVATASGKGSVKPAVHAQVTSAPKAKSVVKPVAHIKPQQAPVVVKRGPVAQPAKKQVENPNVRIVNRNSTGWRAMDKHAPKK